MNIRSVFQKQSLKTQLFVSHLILVGLMVVVMTGAIFSFFRLGRSIDHIFRNNYKSVIAAQSMKDALERIDSSATFVLAGQTQRARIQYEANRQHFADAYNIESHNITEPGEKEMADNIGQTSSSYQKSIENLLYADPPTPTNTARSYYFKTLEPAFMQLKNRAQDVLNLNQAAIVQADMLARAEARRASLISVAVTIGSLILAVLLAVRTVREILIPIRTLTRQAEEIGAGHLDQHIDSHRIDEIGILASTFNRMTGRLLEVKHAQEQQLHLAQRMSDEALTSLFDPVIVTDSKGYIVHVNRAAETVFGSTAELVGRLVSDAIPEEVIVRKIRNAITQCGEHTEDETETVQIKVGSSLRSYYARATSMCDDDATLLGAVVVLEDVTHLTELDRMKTEFISVASHELRTPVASLLLATGLLQEGAVGQLTPQQQEIVKAQMEDLNRLDRLMRDILDLTRLELGTLPPGLEITRPIEVVESAIGSVVSQAEAKGIDLASEVVNDLPTLRVDRAQIIRVLVNLLNNALRHTEPGGSVTVRVAKSGNTISFEVEDTGSGIPGEYLTRIFDRFVQVPGATGGGAGMGLSIAQAIIKSHNGEITAESKPGSGSRFTFTLPVS